MENWVRFAEFNFSRRLARPVIVAAGRLMNGRATSLFRRRHYLIAIGLTGEPTALVIGSGGPQKKNS